MMNSRRLERGYRRLLAFYPRAFRREHGQEILSVLMAGAEEGQRRPRLGESADLLRNGIRMRLRYAISWERSHARVMLPVRIVSGAWLVALTAILYGSGHGGWWGALLVPAVGLHFYFAYRIRRPTPAS